MKALTWHGKRDVRVDTVPDPTIEQPTDAIIRVTSTGLCGSDLHLYEVLGPFLDAGDVLGHEPMGIVEAVGAGVDTWRSAIAWSCRSRSRAGTASCASTGSRASARRRRTATRAWARASSATRKLYGEVPGGQAELLRVPQAHYRPIKVPEGPPDDRFLFLSDVLPTAWQAVRYAEIPDGGSVAVLGLGPDRRHVDADRPAPRRRQVIGLDLVPERLARAEVPWRRDDRPQRRRRRAGGASAS